MFDDTNLVIQAALNGVGLGLAFEGQVAELIEKRRLIRVLEDRCPTFPGFFIVLPEPTIGSRIGATRPQSAANCHRIF